MTNSPGPPSLPRTFKPAYAAENIAVFYTSLIFVSDICSYAQFYNISTVN